MGIIIRQSIKTSIVSYCGVAIGTFNILFLYPKFLLPEQIGLIRLLQDFPILFATFFQLGSANLTERFYVYFASEGKKDKGLPFVIFILPLLGFLLFLLGQFFFYDNIIELYRETSPVFSDFFILVIPLTLIMMYTGVLEAYARVNYRIVVPALVREIFLRFFFSLIVFLYAIKFISPEVLIYLFVAAYFLALLALFAYVNKLKSISYKPDFSGFNKKLINEMIAFVAFLLPGMAGSMIAAKIDTIMLGYMTNLSDTGVYSLAYFIGAVVETPKRALSQISIPVITRAWKEGDKKELLMIYRKSSLHLMIAGGLIFLFIWINIKELFMLMPNGDRYATGTGIVFFIGLSRVFDMATGVNGELIVYSKWFRVNLYMVILLAILTIYFNYLFIPLYGIEGAALATLISISIYNLSKFVFLYFKEKIHPFQLNLIKVLVFLVMAYFIALYLPTLGDSWYMLIASIAYKCALILGAFIWFLKIFKISEDIDNLIEVLYTKLKGMFL